MATVSESPLIAAIDIGSNSIKMTVGRANASGGVTEVDWASEVVRLGQGLDSSGKLDDSRMDAAIGTLERFRERAEQLGASNIVAVATEATRAATNGPDFLKRARTQTGIPIRVLDGDQEAGLTFRGLGATSDLAGQVLVADVGGGSTELISARDSQVQGSASIPLGSGRLTERFITGDPPTESELQASEEAAVEALDARLAELEAVSGEKTRLIIVGGTGEFLARLVPDPSDIDLAAIRGVLARLREMTVSELAQAIQIPEARARVLPAGVAIVAAIVDRVKPRSVEVGRSGVRVGLLLETSESMQVDRRDGDASDHRSNGKVKTLSGTRKDPRHVDANAQGHDFRETMSLLIAQRWEAVWKAVPVALEGTDIEGVHDVRVASRRLRAAMDIAAPAFPRGWYRPLLRTAKEITSALGEVRDRDVLLEALHAERETAPLPERPGIDRLIARVDGERKIARADLETYLQALLNGPIRHEVERRFGQVPGKKAAGNGTGEVRS
jgi:exopolyphosphatase/pppGpp-phosphohydrolase